MLMNAANDNGSFFAERPTQPEPDELDGAALFADGHLGIYLPQYFATTVPRALVDYVSDWVWGELAAGPDTDGYWQAWDHLLDFARIRHPTMGECYLWVTEAGDLWLVPVKEEASHVSE